MGEGRGADPPIRVGSSRGAFPAGGGAGARSQGQAVLTRWLPRAFRPTGLLMVAKFPKSSASGPVPLFCQPLPMLSPTTPKAPPCDAFPRNLIVAIPNGGRAIQLSLRPHLFHHQLTPAHRAHQPVIVGSCRRPIRRPSRTLPRQSAAATPDDRHRERETLPIWPRLPLLSTPPPQPPHPLPLSRPRTPQLVASCRIPWNTLPHQHGCPAQANS